MDVMISFVLTLVVFSYLLGDNLLYRLAVSVFVGLSAAFTTVVTVQSVILPLGDGTERNTQLLVIGLIFTLLLLARPITRLKYLTDIALAFLIAVGAAVAVVGALAGTLLPLLQQTAELDTSSTSAMANGFVIVLGVITSLLYFEYNARRNPDGTVQRGRISGLVGSIGEIFIVITLGTFYGAAILTSLTILTGHISSFFG